MQRDTHQYVAANVTAEVGVKVDPPNVVSGAATEVKQALADEQGKREIAFRILQNTSATDVFFSVGFDKPSETKKVYHGKIPAGAAYDFSRTDKAVYVTADSGAFEVSPMVCSRN